MRVRILPSSFESRGERQYLTSYLINGTVAVDAGSVGICGAPKDQHGISHVFLTHCHADHIGSLPMFLENTYREDGGCVVLYGHPDVLRTLTIHVFNGIIWPDYRKFRSKGKPFVRFAELSGEATVHVQELSITPVQVNHVVPTLGYIVEDEHSAVVFGADSGPTDRIWDLARGVNNLRAVFIEVAFPEELQELALRLGHLTPELLKKEIAKLPDHTSIIATHIKPRYQERVIEELKLLELHELEIGTSGKEYMF